MRLGPTSTRARVLLAALTLLAATIVVAIVVARAVLLDRLDDRLDAELAQEVDEFRQVSGGVDPGTGAPFGSDLGAVFEAYLAQNVPDEDEVLLAIVGETPFARSADPPYPLEDLAQLVTAWIGVESPTFSTDDTPIGAVRSLAVPVLDADGARGGTFVVARFPAGERAEVDDAVRVAAGVGGAAFVVAAILAWAVAGRVLAPLQDLAAATAEINERDLGHRIDVHGGGELAELSRHFNGMLDRVEGAFDAQRAFLDDAGHELRTPITVLRGHLELAPADEPLAADTRLLLLDELDRMSRIVEDLVIVAAAERPDFVRPAPIDVADLTIDVGEKARALGERDWKVEPEALCVARLDRQRIVQAWMNLARNAVQHTAESDEIRIFSRVDGRSLLLGVSDTGEGVAVADRERIFDRFARGLSARRTDADGAGLGLAITAAVAAAHGGTITLTETGRATTTRTDDADGAPAPTGATFTIVVPLEHPSPTDPLEVPWQES